MESVVETEGLKTKTSVSHLDLTKAQKFFFHTLKFVKTKLIVIYYNDQVKIFPPFSTCTFMVYCFDGGSLNFLKEF